MLFISIENHVFIPQLQERNAVGGIHNVPVHYVDAGAPDLAGVVICNPFFEIFCCVYTYYYSCYGGVSNSSVGYCLTSEGANMTNQYNYVVLNMYRGNVRTIGYYQLFQKAIHIFGVPWVKTQQHTENPKITKLCANNALMHHQYGLSRAYLQGPHNAYLGP